MEVTNQARYWHAHDLARRIYAAQRAFLLEDRAKLHISEEECARAGFPTATFDQLPPEEQEERAAFVRARLTGPAADDGRIPFEGAYYMDTANAVRAGILVALGYHG